jgi:hypothetical protein
MKNFPLIAAFFFFSTINAQIANDTVGYTSKADTLYSSPNGGFVSGVNGYGDREKLQVYIPVRPFSIIGYIFATGFKSAPSANPSSRVCLKVKRFDATSTPTAPFSIGPKETKDSVFIPFNSITAAAEFENSLNSGVFSNPILINSSYTIGLNFDSLAAQDTLAVYTTPDDSALIYGRSWELWNNRYQRIGDTWGLNVDLAIFPIIDTLLNGIKILPLVESNVFPVPATELVTVSLLENIGKASVMVLDMTGKMVHYQILEDNITHFQINTSSFRSGKYIIRINGKERMSVSPLLIIR